MISRMKRLTITLTLALLCASCPAYAYAVDADTQQFYTDMNAWMSTINGHLGVISADVTDILQEVSQGITATVSFNDFFNAVVIIRNSGNITMRTWFELALGELQSIHNNTGIISDQLEYQVGNQDLTLGYMVYRIYYQLVNPGTTGTMANTLENIYSYISDIRAKIVGLTFYTPGGTNTHYLNVRQLDTVSPSVDLSGITSQLSTMNANVAAILAKMGVSDNYSTLIGDFDEEAFDDRVDSMLDLASSVAPFGAIYLISSEFNLLNTVSVIQSPTMDWNFNFFGQNTVHIDVSWLDGLKPVINFTTIFLLIYCLAMVSAKYIRTELTW